MSRREQARLRRRHRRAARDFAAAGFFHSEIRQRLLDRLQWIDLQPALCLDLGAGPALATDALLARFPGCRLIALDHAPEMLAAAAGRRCWRVCARAESMPLPDASVDLIFCNLMLAYCRDPSTILAEARRLLNSPGLMSFATLGPKSFQELRRAWAAVDNRTHCPPHPDMHDIGSLLMSRGFAEPVLDREFITVTYADLGRLHADLRGVGSLNHSADRLRGLTGRRTYRRLAGELDRCRNAEGRIPITLDIIFGQAWAGPRPAGQDGEISIPLDRLQAGRRSEADR